MKNLNNNPRPLLPLPAVSAFRLLVLALIFTAAISCNAQKTATDSTATTQTRPERGQRPNLDEIFKMDANQDGKLAKSEVKGPLQRDFATIDTNNDGFLSRTEVENAPQPQGGRRPPRNQ
ncbi:MAG: EF-hand domain-containing protein [Saprospiraceae bacterium]